MTNEDGSVWITYNGGVYNHAALRGDLELRPTGRVTDGSARNDRHRARLGPTISTATSRPSMPTSASRVAGQSSVRIP